FVPQGTATNNTEGRTAGWPVADPGGATSFAVERRAVPEGDGHALVAALGLDRAIADHLAGADLREQDVARAMNAAVFPATLGYVLGRLLPGALTWADVDAAQRWFVDAVRGRGPFPAFRVGGVPYGVLPTTSLARYRPRADAPPVERVLPAL